MTSYISKKLSFHNAEQFKEAFFETDGTIGYVYIGNHLPWDDENDPSVPLDTSVDERFIWDHMYAAKKITGSDVELVVPRYVWQANTKYNQFDDVVEIETLLSANTQGNTFPMYVMNSENDVYKCLCNNVAQASTVEPLGKNLSANGNISTSDGYLWKYLYNVRPSNRFLTNEWMPAPTTTNKLDFDSSPVVHVDGELVKIITTNGGSGYVNNVIDVGPYDTGCTILQLSNTINIVQNMTVTGQGILGGSFIQSVDTLNARITLSTATTQSGGGANNQLNITTRVAIDGDGTGALATAQITGNSITKIVVNSYGRDYTRANVNVFGTGTGATARVVLPPKFGHGFNSAKDLGASNVMVVMRIGEVDSTEGGIISANTSFRQYGLLRDPYKYGRLTPVDVKSANSVVSQTTNLTLISGDLYNLNEFVYQGPDANNATFSGFVYDQTPNELRLTVVKGTITVGVPLRGTITNPTGRVVVNSQNPEFEPYTGDILYSRNKVKTDRTDGQAEILKFVVKF
jgi:hypothetical protein